MKKCLPLIVAFISLLVPTCATAWTVGGHDDDASQHDPLVGRVHYAEPSNIQLKQGRSDEGGSLYDALENPQAGYEKLKENMKIIRHFSGTDNYKIEIIGFCGQERMFWRCML